MQYQRNSLDIFSFTSVVSSPKVRHLHISSQLPERNSKSLVMKITHASNVVWFKGIQQTSPRPQLHSRAWTTHLSQQAPRSPEAGPKPSTGCQVTIIMDLQSLTPAVAGDHLPADLPKPSPLPHYSPASLSSHKTGREQLVGLEGFTGFKNPFSKIARHPTSIPFLSCGIHL